MATLTQSLIPVENTARDETPSRGTGDASVYQAIHQKLFSGIAGQRLADERAARIAREKQYSDDVDELQRAVEMVLAPRDSWASAVRGLLRLEELAHDGDLALSLLHARFFPWLLPLLQCTTPSQVAPDWPRRVCPASATACTVAAPMCGAAQPCGFLPEMAALVLGTAAQNNPDVAAALCGDDVVPLLVNLLRFPSHADVTRRALYALSCLVRSHASCAASAAALPLDRLLTLALQRTTTTATVQRGHLLWTSAVLANFGAMNATAAWCGRMAELVAAERDGISVLDAAVLMLGAGEYLPDACRDRLLAPYVLAAVDRRARNNDLVAQLAIKMRHFQQERADGVPSTATISLVPQ